MNAMFVTKDLHKQSMWSDIKECTQRVTCLCKFLFVTKDLHKQVTYQDIKEDTLERNLMNVMFVTKDLHKHAT